MGPKRRFEATRGLFGQGQGVETTQSGGCTLETCPQDYNSDHVAQDMAKFWVLALLSPE